MERKKERFAPPAVGGSALLAVFAVLCLTVFALLSLSTVRADGRVADSSRNAVKAYYEADTKAEEIFARLRSGEGVDDVDLSATIYDYADHGEVAVSYTVPISDTQELRVELLDRDGTWTVTRWQACPVGDEEFDDFLDLWDGDGTTF